ncbi:hypothetical protein DFP72DRAFT_987090 [Ephemerocybe angulata]|uniref:HIT-type domain-containing protein n=1 Tax=Ephemerocybe angulata TaxID=980116 RepID=A0A8H6IBU3_9AGAR|nr:hypothetical protein DFP72DRAFT_987090 [Tulosesus angulatus]
MVASDAVSPPCAICNAHPSKYTCPRCHTRFLLPRAASGCSGERNKAAYVSMEEYGWGKMMDDYTFLEDVGRKVGAWGRDIVQGGYSHGAGEATGRRGMGATAMRGGRGRGGARGGGGGGKTKRDIYKMQMEVRDIDVELLPLGMKRRKANQSGWDFKKQTGILTIEFKFHRPRDPLAPSSQPDEPPLTFLTHRNLMSKSLLSILQTVIKDRSHTSSKKGASNNQTGSNLSTNPSCPEWLQTLTLPSLEDPEGFTPPHCVMSAPLDPLAIYASGMKLKKAWYKLDLDKPLAAALKNTQFVEFPTIEVWEEFNGAIVDPEGRVKQPGLEDEPPMKRRRLDKRVAKERMNGLVGGYGSDEGIEGEDGEEKRTVMSLLGEYSEGDGEDEDVDMEKGGAALALSDEEEAEKELEPAALMELFRQMKGQHWTVPDTGEEEALAWGDEDLSDADAEGEDDPDHFEGDEIE